MNILPTTLTQINIYGLMLHIPTCLKRGHPHFHGHSHTYHMCLGAFYGCMMSWPGARPTMI